MKQDNKVIEQIFIPKLTPNCEEFTIKSTNSASIIPSEMFYKTDCEVLLSNLYLFIKTRKNIPIKVGIIPIVITIITKLKGSVIR